MPELTGPQITVQPTYSDTVPKLTLRKLRRMRRDPVINLVRRMFFAGILSGEWSFEGAADDTDQEMIDFIEAQLTPIRRHFLATGALGCFDFGWQPYEKIFEIDATDMSTKLRKLKPLLQDDTTIEEDLDTGAFLGFTNGDAELDRSKCLLLNWDVEGTSWKGQSTLENAEGPYDSTVTLNGAAQRFDKKMAGAHWVIKYPDTKVTFEGKEVSASDVADAVLKSLMSSGGVTIPQAKSLGFDAGGQPAPGWEIELITASGAVVDFIARFEYLDKSKARALGFPERSILEGLHGTKAEAGEHKDFVITNIEYRHDCLLEQLNWHLVNQLLRMNFGVQSENQVVVKASPIGDSDRTMLYELYMKILDNPDGFLREVDALDVQAMADSLGIPRIEEEMPDGSQLPETIPAGGTRESNGVPEQTDQVVV